MSSDKKKKLKLDDFDGKIRVALIKKNDFLWDVVKDNSSILLDIVNQGKSPLTDTEADLLVGCVQLVLSELIIKNDEFSKYKLVKMSETKYLSSMAEHIKNIPSDMQDYNVNNKKIDSLRKFVWGYIRKYEDLITNLLIKMSDESFINDDTQELGEIDISIIMHCTAAVLVESALRQRERMLLENNPL